MGTPRPHHHQRQLPSHLILCLFLTLLLVFAEGKKHHKKKPHIPLVGQPEATPSVTASAVLAALPEPNIKYYYGGYGYSGYGYDGGANGPYPNCPQCNFNCNCNNIGGAGGYGHGHTVTVYEPPWQPTSHWEPHTWQPTSTWEPHTWQPTSHWHPTSYWHSTPAYTPPPTYAPPPPSTYEPPPTTPAPLPSGIATVKVESPIDAYCGTVTFTKLSQPTVGHGPCGFVKLVPGEGERVRLAGVMALSAWVVGVFSAQLLARWMWFARV